MSLSQICLVIDMDGFHVGKSFRPRELGFSSLTQNYSSSYRFKLNSHEMSEKDWQTARFCTKYIHGLSFKPLPAEKDLNDLRNLDDIVQSIYASAKTEKKTLVAFKGGHVEKDLLRKLEIPHINLEIFKCPKYDDLPDILTIKDCGYHKKPLGKKKIHCPIQECFAFAKWIEHHNTMDFFTDDVKVAPEYINVHFGDSISKYKLI